MEGDDILEDLLERAGRAETEPRVDLCDVGDLSRQVLEARPISLAVGNADDLGALAGHGLHEPGERLNSHFFIRTDVEDLAGRVGLVHERDVAAENVGNALEAAGLRTIPVDLDRTGLERLLDERLEIMRYYPV